MGCIGGSVFNVPGSKEPKDLVLDYLSKHKANWGEIKSSADLERHKTKMKNLVEDVLHTNLHDLQGAGGFSTRKVAGDIAIRSFKLEPENGIVLPGVLLEPVKTVSDPKIILYIHEKGKSEILKNMDITKELLSKGYTICAVDLRGIGETSPDMANKFWDFLAGKPIFGQRVKDVLTILQWLKGPEVEAREIKIWGTGMGALYGAFAGVLDNDVTDFVFEEPLISFESVVQVEVPAFQHEVILPGILETLDMTQEYQALCPRSVLLLNPLSGDKSYAEMPELGKATKPVSNTYEVLKRPGAWQMQRISNAEKRNTIMNWLE